MSFSGTRKKKVRCHCPSGHVFTGEIFEVIDLSETPGAVMELVNCGMPVSICGQCEGECATAEPVILHDPVHEALALFVPSVISHNEMAARGALLSRLAASDPGETPEYCYKFVTLVGQDALNLWHHQLGSPSDALKTPLKTRSTSPGNLKPIHEAFADLADPNQSFPTIPPTPYKEDTLSDAERESETKNTDTRKGKDWYPDR